MPDLDTFDKRMDAVQKLIEANANNMSPSEVLRFLYHWFMYERNMYRQARAFKKIMKHATYLDGESTVLIFRKALDEL